MEGSLPTLEEGNLDQFRTFQTFGSSSTILDQSPFPDTWKKEKTCAICEVKLSTGRGDPQKRHGCRFCLHAVCTKCSPMRFLHADSGRMERICTNCFKGQLEEQVRSEDAASKLQRDAEWVEMSQKLLKEVQRRTELESSLSRLRFVREENESVKAQLATEAGKLQAAEARLASVEGELATQKLESAFQEKNFETTLMTLQQSVDKYRKTLVLKTAEVVSVKKQLEQYKALVENLKPGEEQENAQTEGSFLATAEHLHTMQVEEISAQLAEIKAQLARRERENDALVTRLRETEESSSEKISTVLQEAHATLRRLSEAEKENERLREELAELREQMDKVVRGTQLDTDSLFHELKLTSERRISALKDSLSQTQEEKEALEREKEEMSKELQRVQSDLEEQQSLLSLAKDDILSENQEKMELEAKLQRFAEYMSRLEEFDQLSLKLKEQSSQGAMAVDLISRQRLEIEHYKLQLRTTQEALEKCEELIRAGHDQHQTERRLIAKREAEIEVLRESLLSKGVDVTGLFSRTEGETDLTRILREKEANVGKLGQELQENMQKVKVAGGRRSRPSGGSGNLPRKPPVSTDPCACSIF